MPLRARNAARYQSALAINFRRASDVPIDVYKRQVQGLGEDAGGRGLPGAARAGEQVGMGDAVVAHGVAQAEDHVGLASDLGKPLRPIPPIERLELFGHGDRH